MKIMGDMNLRVYPVEGDGYGEVIEYPQYAGYRMVPMEPGATGDKNHELVVYRKPEPGTDQDETELGRHRMSEILIVWPGQPSPVTIRDDADDSSSTKSSSSSTKAGTATKSSTTSTSK